MKLFPSIAAAAIALLTASTSRAAEADAPTTEALEAKFKGTMTAATMAGRWCAVKDGALGPEKDDKYSIVGVEKKDGSSWVINASMKYGPKEIVIPIPVQVKWAGDTAVIIVDRLQIPGAPAGTGPAYSARVLIHDQEYAGTWSGGDHSGLIKGLITNEKSAGTTAKP